MIIWQRSVSRTWLEENESRLEELAGSDLAIIARPGRVLSLVQITCRHRVLATQLIHRFGGKTKPIPGDLWKLYAKASAHPPIRIGRRLEILSAPTRVSSLDRRRARRPGRTGNRASGGTLAQRPDRSKNRTSNCTLVIPAAGAFGTGEHSTTAMSLRLLEEMTRDFRAGWRLLDAGTGSGILALAARRFGASETLGLDNDPRAVTNAIYNARLNQIARARFIVADILRFKPRGRYEVVTANLFSDLLIAVLPVFRRGLKAAGVLIVSGILREQADSVLTALHRAGFDLEKKRRRGKWLALQARAKEANKERLFAVTDAKQRPGFQTAVGAQRPKVTKQDLQD